MLAEIIAVARDLEEFLFQKRMGVALVDGFVHAPAHVRKMLFADAGDGVLRIQVLPKPPRVLFDGIPVQRELRGLQGYALHCPVVRLKGKGLAEAVRRLVVTHGGAEDVSGGA